MSYTITNPQPPNLQTGERAVTLSNCTAAIRLVVVPGGDGNPIVTAYARVINADGTPFQDPHGYPVTAAYSLSVTPAVLAQCGSRGAVQKCVLLTVLGESSAPLVPSPPFVGDIVSNMKAAQAITTPAIDTLLT